MTRPAAGFYLLVVLPLIGPSRTMRDRSPDITNLAQNLNCSDDDRLLILNYDSHKYDLVDTVIPILTAVFSVIGLVINGIFIYLTIRGIRDKKLPFKGYSLLLNRSFTDVITSILTLIFVSLHKFDQVNDPALYPDDYKNQTILDLDYLIPHGRTVFTLLLTLDFWAAAGCYAVLALFMYFAVKHPMFYMIKITDRKTVFVGVGVWLVGLIYAIVVVCISSNDAFNVFNSNDADLIQWEVSTSDFALSISNLFIVLLALLIVCISYGAIVIYLWRASRKQGDATLHLVSIARIALNVFAFTISCIVMACFVSIPLILKNHIDSLNGELGSDIKSECKTVVDAYHLGMSMAAWTTAAMTGWQLRMVLDPLANLLLDSRFKQLWKDICCQTLPFKENFSLRSTEAATEFLRKCKAMNVTPISVITGDTGHYFRFRTASSVTTSLAETPTVKKKTRNVRRFTNMGLDGRVL